MQTILQDGRYNQYTVNRTLRLLFFLVLVIVVGLPSLPAAAQDGYVPGEIIVKFKPHVVLREIDKTPSLKSLLEENKVTKVTKLFKDAIRFPTSIEEIKSKFPRRARRIPKDVVLPIFSNVCKVKVPEDVDIKQVIKNLRRNPYIEYAHPNYYLQDDETIPTYLYDGIEYWHRNDGETVLTLIGETGTAGADIKSTFAWDITQGSPEVIVAVLDTGLTDDEINPIFTENLWENSVELAGVEGVDDDLNGYVDDVNGWNFHDRDVSGEGNPDFSDESGHGTTVASLVSTNWLYTIGTTRYCRVMPLKRSGDGPDPLTDSVEALVYAINNGADIINCSWGRDTLDEDMELVSDAIDYARSNGVLVVASAGNDSVNINLAESPHYPASFSQDNIISVAATDHHDELCSFSNYGDEAVDIAAPGYRMYLPNDIPGADFIHSGTSFSTPLVAGAAALLLSVDSTLTPQEIKTIFMDTADDQPSLQGNMVSEGRLNIFNALLAAGGTFEVEVTVEASAVPDAPSALGPAQCVDGSRMNDPTPTLEFMLSDPDESDLVKYQIQIDDQPYFTSPVVDETSALVSQGAVTYTPTVELPNDNYYHNYYWRVKAIDEHGAESSWEAANEGNIAFRLDTQPPTFSAGSVIGPSSPTNSADLTFSWPVASDGCCGLAGYLYLLDNSPSTISGITNEIHSLWTIVTAPGEGTWYFHVAAQDLAGNVSSVLHSEPVVVDFIENNPELSVSSDQLNFAYYYVNDINDGSITPVSNSVTVSNAVADSGEFYFTVSADEWLNVTPQAGTVSATTPVELAIEIDQDLMPVAEGTYLGTIEITAENAEASPQEILVSLEIVQLSEPVISGLSQNLGPAGTMVIISGMDFGDTQADSQVRFNREGTSAVARVVSWSDTEIVAEVPTSLNVGSYDVEIYVMRTVAEGVEMTLQSEVVNFQVTTAIAASGVATIYPNPFNPAQSETVTIQFSPGSVTNIGVYIYSATARLVKHEVLTGVTQTTWDGRDVYGDVVSEGVYLVRVVNEENKDLIAKGKILAIKN